MVAGSNPAGRTKNPIHYGGAIFFFPADQEVIESIAWI